MRTKTICIVCDEEFDRIPGERELVCSDFCLLQIVELDSDNLPIVDYELPPWRDYENDAPSSHTDSLDEFTDTN